MLLSNGLGGTVAAWRHLVNYFGESSMEGGRSAGPGFRFVSWDYRGLYKSRLPQESGRLDVVDHARDAQALLAHLEVSRAVVLGWSMGAQVNFELYRLCPELFRALVIINGTYGHPFETAVDARFKLVGNVLPGVAAFAGKNAHHWVPIMRWLVSQPRFMQLFKTIGLAAESLDEEVFRELASDYTALDFNVYMELIKRLGEHTAEDVLPSIRVPTLVLAGARDLFTPPSVSERLRRKIPGAELLVIRGGTHYVPVEFPELLNLRIEKFLRSHGLLRPGSPASAPSPLSPPGRAGRLV